MSVDRSHLTDAARRLPELSLPSWPGGDVLAVQPPGRRSVAIVMIHGGDCGSCGAFVLKLERAASALEEWDCRVRIILPSDPRTGQDTGSDPGILYMVDQDQRLARTLDLAPPAIVLADQWRQIHVADEAGADHRFPTPEELISWARFLAVQCPECEGEAL